MIRKQLTDRARDFNIILDDVSITELSFGKDYSAAVEAKQIAQQEAQRAVYMVEKAKQEKQQKIVQAEVGNILIVAHYDLTLFSMIGRDCSSHHVGSSHQSEPWIPQAEETGSIKENFLHHCPVTEQSVPQCWILDVGCCQPHF